MLTFLASYPAPGYHVNVADLSPARLDSALELMYYAFKRLVEAPDRLLASRGLARAHHRILYFVARKPELTVGDLLAALQVTKQALNRPLRELIDRGYIRVTPDGRDRRVRRLRLSLAGRTLEERLTGMQLARFRRVLGRAGPKQEANWRAVMSDLGSSR
jgi:DNA-binding MarR family transcriptional regulator